MKKKGAVFFLKAIKQYHQENRAQEISIILTLRCPLTFNLENQFN